MAPALLAGLVPALRLPALALGALGLAVVQVFLQADRTLLAVLGLHVDGRVLEMVVTPGGLAALDMQAGERLRIAAGIALLLAGEAALLALAWRGARAGAAWPGRLGRAGAAAAVLLFAGERAAYAAAAAAGWGDPIRAAAALPAHGLERSLRLRLSPGERLRTLRAPLRARPVEDPPDLVMVVVESWRADGLSPELMPALWRFSEGALRFENHRSGGNWTYAGVFSLFYGLHGAYAAAAQASRRGPVLLDRLLALGYEVRVVASRSTRFPRFRDTVFAALPAGAVEDELPGEDSAVRDRAAVARAVALLEGRSRERPLALLVFLDATHLPYAFAPESARFRPYTDRLYYTEMTEPQPPGPIRNRYLNALADVDRTAGALLEAVARLGRPGRTAVVLTGDHGQELYEHGALGHNIAFTREQTAVPLVLRLPGVAPGVRTDLTRHVDVAPTLLALLGVENPPGDLSLGASLLDGPPATRAVACGFLDCAVLDADGTTTAFRPGEPALPPRAWDAAWRPLPPGTASPALPEVRRELSAFLE